MKYNEAIKKINDERNLIGTSDGKGAVLDELVLVPVGQEDLFWRCYLDTRDATLALNLLASMIGPIIYDCDFCIYAVYNKSFINEYSLLMNTPLYQ